MDPILQQELLRLDKRPFDIHVGELLDSHFNVQLKAYKQLDGYNDCNYLVTLVNGDECVLKVHNGVDSENEPMLLAQNAVLLHCSQHGIQCPLPIDREMHYTAKEKFAVRLLTYVKGPTLQGLSEITLNTLGTAGAYFGRLRLVLDDFDHIGAHRSHQWDLAHFSSLRGLMKECVEEKDLLLQVLTAYEENTWNLKKGIIHGDFNDGNIIMCSDQVTIFGVIDFGDMVYSCVLFDLAIAMAYAMLRYKDQPMEAGIRFLKGYRSVVQLDEKDIDHLLLLICCRLATSVTIGLDAYKRQPENKYLLVHVRPAWDTLVYLWKEQTRLNLDTFPKID